MDTVLLFGKRVVGTGIAEEPDELTRLTSGSERGEAREGYPRLDSNAANLSDLPATELVLERLPNGEYAWLRPERHYVMPSRYYLTDKGRRALAEAALFGPWPTLGEVGAIR